ncbi:Vacuolar protein sorting-associated protein vps5 [Leucoagaricus sp. SymC.cos]|nr:Vacuolar protein sorting-associated protein vps5 [Leucoagaricus sp. SymC.cos]
MLFDGQKIITSVFGLSPDRHIRLDFHPTLAMDGFDDLLAPSRRDLEDNPFANPFSGDRSHSPDPWASPFTNTQQNSVFGSSSALDPYANPYASLTSSASHHEEREEEDKEDHTTTATTSPTATKAEELPLGDPLDSAAHANDDDDEPPQPRLPGFKQSHDSSKPSFDEIATIRPTEPERFDDSPVASSTQPRPITPSSMSPKAPQTSHEEHTEQERVHKDADSPNGSSGFIAHTPTIPASESKPAAKSPDFSSPLDGGLDGGSGGLGIDSSLASLTLGRDTFGSGVGGLNGGWGGDIGWGASSEPTPTTSSGPSLAGPSSSQQQNDDDDSDDDKPISQTLSRIQSEDPDRAKALNARAGGKANIQPVYVITVDDPQKVGDPIRSFTMYTVHTRTTSPMYQKSSFSVLRRYSDFLWLYEALQFNNPGVVVPPPPEKNTFGRFDDAFVRQRRLSLQKCIQKIANHPILGKDEDLKFFLESDTFALDMKHRKAESAHEKGGLIASIGQTLTGSRFHETDEWFDRQKVYLDNLESQLKGLVKAIELVSKQRADLATVTGEFAQTISDLAGSDVGTQLSQSLSGLADVERKAQELQTIQSDQDLVTILATSDEYSRLINSVRLAFTSRIRTYHQWKNSESDLLRIKRNHEKNRAQGQIPTDRLSYSLQQIAEAERRAAESKLEYEQVSKLVKQEVARFEQERIEDFKDSLQAFLEGMITRQKELIATWENYQQMLLKRAEGISGQTPVLHS